MNFKQGAVDFLPQIQKWRRHIHQHPERSFKEKETTGYIEKELRGMGISVTRFPDFYGLTATIQGGNRGKRSCSEPI